MSRRDRAVPFLRMKFVMRKVFYVIEQINARRQRREHKHRERRSTQRLPHARFPQMPLLVEGEQKARVQKNILGPLLRSQRQKQRKNQRARFFVSV